MILVQNNNWLMIVTDYIIGVIDIGFAINNFQAGRMTMGYITGGLGILLIIVGTMLLVQQLKEK